MKEDLLENVAEGHIYTVRTIVISALFGGLLAGGIMIYQNFKTFGEHKKASVTILITITFLVALIATSLLPVLEKIPNIFYTILITLATSVLAKKYQGNLIEHHLSTGGKIFSTGRAVVICIISILIVVAFLLGAYFMQDAAIGNL
jgi:hypothetical protein